MKNIFLIELKRLITNKMTIALIAIVTIYSYYILEQDIILGVNGTAPYSSLSIRTYLIKLTPLLILGLLLLISSLYSKRAKKVFVLFNATKVNRKKYFCIRYLVITLVFICICLIPTLIIRMVCTYYISFL